MRVAPYFASYALMCWFSHALPGKGKNEQVQLQKSMETKEGVQYALQSALVYAFTAHIWEQKPCKGWSLRCLGVVDVLLSPCA